MEKNNYSKDLIQEQINNLVLIILSHLDQKGSLKKEIQALEKLIK